MRANMVVNLQMTPFGKFILVRTFDGYTILYETLTGIFWRTDKIRGNHSGLAIAHTNIFYEYIQEGKEIPVLYKLMEDGN